MLCVLSLKSYNLCYILKNSNAIFFTDIISMALWVWENLVPECQNYLPVIIEKTLRTSLLISKMNKCKVYTATCRVFFFFPKNRESFFLRKS